MYATVQVHNYLSIVSLWYLFNTGSNLLSFPLIYLLSCGVNPTYPLEIRTNINVIPILYRSRRADYFAIDEEDFDRYCEIGTVLCTIDRLV